MNVCEYCGNKDFDRNCENCWNYSNFSELFPEDEPSQIGLL